MGLGIRDPGSGKKPIPDPGSGSKRHRIPDPDPQYWSQVNAALKRWMTDYGTVERWLSMLPN
jgi:hypothetical protein